MPGRTNSVGKPIAPGIIARFTEGLRQARAGFSDAFFPPGVPQQPTAPAGVDEARRLDYPYGINVYRQPRGDQPITFPQLRDLGRSLDILRVVIEKRKDQMERMRWEFRLRKTPGETRAQAKQRQDSDPRIAALTAFWERPDRINGWNQWMRMLLEDMFVIDAASVYRRQSKGGQVYAAEILDGSTIKPLIDDKGRPPAFPNPAFEQWIKGMPAWNFTTADLIYAVRNPMSNRFYGFSPVEQILITINIAIRRTAMQLEEYVSGNIPTALLRAPDNWTPEQMARAQKYMDALLSGNLPNRAKAIFIPNCDPVFPQKDVLKDEFDDWLARVVCFAFSIPPTALVKVTGAMARAESKEQSDAAAQEGLLPIMAWVKGVVDQATHEWFGYRDIEFVFADAPEADRVKQAQIDEIHIKNGLRSINEIRGRDGLDPIPGGDEPGFLLASGYVPLSESLAQAQANTQAAKNPPAPIHIMPGAAPKPGGQPPAGKQPPAGNEPPPAKGSAAKALALLKNAVY